MKYLLLAIFWIAMIILVYPVGEFPLNDDWAYYKDLSILVHQGRLEIVNWSAMTLVSQLFIGAFWCKLFGFSFIGLRILTSLVGLLGLFVSFKLLNEITKNEKTAFVYTLVIAINPLFFHLSNSFMTDIYFYTISTTAVFFFYRSFHSDKIRDIAPATIFLLIAVLVRQIGIVIAVSFAITYLYQAKSFDKNILAKALIPLLLSGLTLYWYSIWITTYQTNLQTYVSTGTAVSTLLGKDTLMHIFNRIGTTGLTISLFLSPLLILTFPHFWANFLKKENRIALYITAVCIIPLIRAWKHFPVGNVMYDLGIGPKLLNDAEIQHINFDFSLPPFAINTVRAFCFAGALMIFYYCFSFIINRFKKENRTTLTKENAFSFFSFLNIIFLFGTFIIPSFFFDRYLIQITLPFMVVIIPFISPLTANLKNAYFALGVACLITLFSIFATHDYFEWNRARWQGIHYLLDDLKASPKEIDGGFEFNGWYGTEYKDDPNNKTKSWWFVTDDQYRLSFSPLEGYEIINHYAYKKYLTFSNDYIYVLRKMP